MFWQVGSSATLGSGSVFRGNIMALASITVNNGVTIHGRALARTGAVTLINDRFSSITCAQPPAGGGGTTVPVTTPGTPGTPGTNGGPGTPHVVGPPRTGGSPMSSESFPWPAVVLTALIGAGTTGAFLNHRVRRAAIVDDARHHAGHETTAHATSSRR